MAGFRVLHPFIGLSLSRWETQPRRPRNLVGSPMGQRQDGNLEVWLSRPCSPTLRSTG